MGTGVHRRCRPRPPRPGGAVRPACTTGSALDRVTGHRATPDPQTIELPGAADPEGGLAEQGIAAAWPPSAFPLSSRACDGGSSLARLSCAGKWHWLHRLSAAVGRILAMALNEVILRAKSIFPGGRAHGGAHAAGGQ